jgi:hypothetical protein
MKYKEQSSTNNNNAVSTYDPTTSSNINHQENTIPTTKNLVINETTDILSPVMLSPVKEIVSSSSSSTSTFSRENNQVEPSCAALTLVSTFPDEMTKRQQKHQSKNDINANCSDSVTTLVMSNVQREV